MHRRVPCVVLLGALLAFTAACTNKKVNNPLANVGSKQPDKVLFDRAMDAMKHAKYDDCLLYTSPSPRDGLLSRMPSSA